jgi:hypothetical protein
MKEPAFVGTGKKAFCCEEHADSYGSKIKKCGKNLKEGCCCG